MSGPRLASKHGKIRTGPQVRFCRLPGLTERGQGQTKPGPVADIDKQNQRIFNLTNLSGPLTYVPRRAVDSNRKTGSPRLTRYAFAPAAILGNLVEKLQENPTHAGESF